MNDVPFSFVTCASDVATLRKRLLASECLAERRYPLAVHFDARSAADAFNGELSCASGREWLVWAHQDMFLPAGWDRRFSLAIADAMSRFPRLAVVGVYGIAAQVGSAPERAGHILDRGVLLREPRPLPSVAMSLDECLFAVKSESGLMLDPALGFDFYATDLVLSAIETGWEAAIVDAYCEHWSNTPSQGLIEARVAERVITNASVFEEKWAARMPIHTPCFSISRPGDTKRFIDAHFLFPS